MRPLFSSEFCPRDCDKLAPVRETGKYELSMSPWRIRMDYLYAKPKIWVSPPASAPAAHVTRVPNGHVMNYSAVLRYDPVAKTWIEVK